MRLIDADELIRDIKENSKLCIFDSLASKQAYNNMVEFAIDSIEGAETIYNGDRLEELIEADKEGRCLMLPAGFEFENGIYVLCGDISKVKEDKKGYSIKSEKAYFLIKNEEKYIFVSIANMSESLLKYYETQIGMINAKKYLNKKIRSE